MPIHTDSQFDRRLINLDERHWNKIVEADAARVSQFGKFISIRSLANSTGIIYNSLKVVAEEGVKVTADMVEMYADTQRLIAVQMDSMFEKLILGNTSISLPNVKEERMVGLFGVYYSRPTHMVIRDNQMAFLINKVHWAPVGTKFVEAVGEKFVIFRVAPGGMFTSEDSAVIAIGENSLADISPSLSKYVGRVIDKVSEDPDVIESFQRLTNVLCPSKAKAEQIKQAQEKYGQNFGSWA